MKEVELLRADNERLHEEIGNWHDIVFDMGAEITQLYRDINDIEKIIADHEKILCLPDARVIKLIWEITRRALKNYEFPK